MPSGPVPAPLADAPHLRLPPEPASVAKARAFLAEHCPYDGETRETAELLVSELATNVVLHARTQMVVAVAAGNGRVVLAVTDGSDQLPAGPTRPDAAATDQQAESGRGLVLLRQLATEWGVAAHANGKTVWCLVAVAS
jgi:anti-sigma regulatory factor (Ser/Thr protein kinase)